MTLTDDPNPISITITLKDGSIKHHRFHRSVVEDGFVKLEYASGSVQAYAVDSIQSYFFNPYEG